MLPFIVSANKHFEKKSQVSSHAMSHVIFHGKYYDMSSHVTCYKLRYVMSCHDLSHVKNLVICHITYHAIKFAFCDEVVSNSKKVRS